MIAERLWQCWRETDCEGERGRGVSLSGRLFFYFQLFSQAEPHSNDATVSAKRERVATVWVSGEESAPSAHYLVTYSNR